MTGHVPRGPEEGEEQDHLMRLMRRKRLQLHRKKGRPLKQSYWITELQIAYPFPRYPDKPTFRGIQPRNTKSSSNTKNKRNF